MKEQITCPNCQLIFNISSPEKNIRYCPFCRHSLFSEKATTVALDTKNNTTSSPSTTISFLDEHLPQNEPILYSIGPYQILRIIGKGGMGEVFLAYDTSCGRRLALKKIRPDLTEHKQLHNRFIKEARITSQLTHPAIIPIYAIHNEQEQTYYTMPYIEGETLKQLLRTARQQEKKGEKVHHIAESIPGLIRIFLSICQAVAYSHSKHILHRDLKPENIIVGQYGQIVILDWGLAKVVKTKATSYIEPDLEEEEENDDLHHLTRMGKVVGTIAYMAPERALGQPANFQTEIYSLGAILYQLLTLKHPFHRESLKQFRKNMHQEKLTVPEEIAPYRDVPRSLSFVVMKCLSPSPDLRYKCVDDLIHDLENYIEGRSEWFQIANLRIDKKSDWEFQENIFIAEHVALTQGMEESDWVNLMISKDSFQETLKIETSVKIGEKGNGIGFLLSIPETAERNHLNDGYCLWLGTCNNKSTKLLRSTVEVMNMQDVCLNHQEWYDIRIEKIENSIHFFLNNILQFSYISHIPIAGTHIGLLLRDADFSIKKLSIFVRSQNVMINCLAVPDAFLAHKDYITALSEYRRIGYSFPGRAEGREAMFRAGVTLLEQANNTIDSEQKYLLFEAAQDEFHKLHNTPGAPLEYLGKALIYQALKDYDEEAKCFELAYRRYPHHPLLPILQEQIVYRMHDSSRHNRLATFYFILLTLTYIPEVSQNANTMKLLQSLDKHWEPLFFIESDKNNKTSLQLNNKLYAIKLAFWLGRPYVLSELIDDLATIPEFNPILIGNALFCLIELGSWKLAEKKLNDLSKLKLEKDIFSFNYFSETLRIAILSHSETLENSIKILIKQRPQIASIQIERIFLHIFELALDQKKSSLVYDLIEKIKDWPLSSEAKIKRDCYEIWAFLLEKNWEKAAEKLQNYPLELLSQETSLLHFLYGCWLEATEGKEISSIHFSGIFEIPYPRTWSLTTSYLSGKIKENHGWILKSFLWERKQLYRQLSLYFFCAGEMEKSDYYHKKSLNEIIDAEVF